MRKIKMAGNNQELVLAVAQQQALLTQLEIKEQINRMLSALKPILPVPSYPVYSYKNSFLSYISARNDINQNDVDQSLNSQLTIYLHESGFSNTESTVIAREIIDELNNYLDGKG